MVLAFALCIALVQTNTNDFDQALSLWKEFDLPIPKANAVPILYGPGFGRTEEEHAWTIAFQDEDNIYFGAQKLNKSTDDAVQVLGWTAPIPQNLILTFGLRQFTEDEEASVAVQSLALGHPEFAAKLLNLPTKKTVMRLDTEFIGRPKDNSLAARTAVVIATRLANDYCNPKSDAKAILQKVIRLNRHGLIHRSNQWLARGPEEFIEELRAVLKPSAAPGHSAQLHVDRLVNAWTDRNEPPKYPIWGEIPEVASVMKLGLQAVPALAAELDRNRITKIFSSRFMNSPPCIVSTSTLADWMIHEIAKPDLIHDSLNQKMVLAWYNAKKKKRG